MNLSPGNDDRGFPFPEIWFRSVKLGSIGKKMPEGVPWTSFTEAEKVCIIEMDAGRLYSSISGGSSHSDSAPQEEERVAECSGMSSA